MTFVHHPAVWYAPRPVFCLLGVQFPKSRSLALRSGLPLGCVVTPLPELLQQPPVLQRPPLSCDRCGAFVNPHCTVGGRSRGGMHWQPVMNVKLLMRTPRLQVNPQNGEWECVFCGSRNAAAGVLAVQDVQVMTFG